MTKRVGAFAVILLSILNPRLSFAAPAVTSIQGTFGDHQMVTVYGSNFGSKSPAAPLVWADFNTDLNPGVGGINRAWTENQNVQWSPSEGVNGTGCAKATDGSGSWTLRVDYNSWTNDGQQMYLYRKEKLNFIVSGTGQNYKTWRMWPAGNGYPNIYASTSHGRVFVENVGGTGGYWASISPTTTNWQTQEFIFKASSMDQENGSLTIRQDGNVVGDGSIMTRSSAAPALMQWNYVVHGEAANTSTWTPPWAATNRMWDDDVYVDNTWARVILGNAATYAACTKIEIQIPNAWSASSIGMMARTGGVFAQGSTAYLYVLDSAGLVNAQGFAVRIGAPGAGAPPDVTPHGLVASAGPDSVATVGAALPLHGTIQAGAASNVTSQWSMISGPGTVQFDNVSDPSTNARFSATGTYVLQFSASDGTTQAADSLRVDVIRSTIGDGAVAAKNVFNPARGETFSIVHVLGEPGRLEADIIDRSGHIVRSLDGGERPAGEQVIEWDGRNTDGSIVASGIYLVVRHANGQRATNKVAVIK